MDFQGRRKGPARLLHLTQSPTAGDREAPAVIRSGRAASPTVVAPSLEMHNAAILAELCGIDAAGLEKLRADGVV